MKTDSDLRSFLATSVADLLTHRASLAAPLQPLPDATSERVAAHSAAAKAFREIAGHQLAARIDAVQHGLPDPLLMPPITNPTRGA